MKISSVVFESIKAKYGHCASWAIWAAEGIKPKDNIGDLSIFDLGRNSNLLDQLNPSIVLVGLNISRRIEVPLGNFHDPKPQAMDYKIRFALKGTRFWGAYMTDIIKDFEQKASGDVVSYLKSNRQFEQTSITTFLEELKDIGANKPTLVAFGRDAHQILTRNLGKEYEILKVPHYSNRIGKEEYRTQVHSALRLQ